MWQIAGMPNGRANHYTTAHLTAKPIEMYILSNGRFQIHVKPFEFTCSIILGSLILLLKKSFVRKLLDRNYFSTSRSPAKQVSG